MDFENSAKQFAPILKDFFESYVEKDASVSNKEWLKNQLEKQALDFAKDKLQAYSDELVDGVDSYDKTLTSIREHTAKGGKVETWLAENVAKSGRQLSQSELQTVEKVLGQGGEQLLRSLKAGELHRDALKSADEFIAENTLVNDFNSASAAQGGRYVAEVDVTGDGSVYGRNQFDIALVDKLTGQKLSNYLVKYGKTASDTIEMVKTIGNAGETLLVPSEQLEEVKKALPGWKVADALGGTPFVKVMSSPLTKTLVDKCLNGELLDTAKQIANKSPAEMIENIAGIAKTSGVLSAGVLGGLEKLANNEPIGSVNVRKMVEQAVESGNLQGLKTAASGALATYVQKGMTKLIPKNTPASVISGIASTGIETINILNKVSNGTMSVSQAMEDFASQKVATVFENVWGKFAKKATVVALNYVPVVGPYLSSLVASGTLDFVGTAIKQKVTHVVKEKIVPVVKTVVHKVCSTVRSVASTMWSGVKSLAKSVFSWF